MSEKLRRFFSRNIVVVLARCLIAVGLIFYLVYYLDLEKILAGLAIADYRIVFGVFVLSFLNLFLQYKKWQIVSRNQLGIKNNLDVLHSLFYGLSAGAFTPMKIGEFAARAIPYKDHGIVEVSIATLIDKIIPMLIVLAAGTVLSLTFLVSQNILSVVGLVIAIILLSCIAGFIILAKSRSRNLIAGIITKLKNIGWIRKAFDQFTVIRLVRGEYLYKLILLSLLFHLTFTSQFALLLIAFSHEWNFLLYIYIANLVVFVQVIIPPVAFGELGIREGAAVYFTESFGMNALIGFNAALLLFVINFILPSLYGLYFIIVRKK